MIVPPQRDSPCSHMWESGIHPSVMIEVKNGHTHCRHARTWPWHFNFEFSFSAGSGKQLALCNSRSRSDRQHDRCCSRSRLPRGRNFTRQASLFALVSKAAISVVSPNPVELGVETSPPVRSPLRRGIEGRIALYCATKRSRSPSWS